MAPADCMHTRAVSRSHFVFYHSKYHEEQIMTQTDKTRKTRQTSQTAAAASAQPAAPAIAIRKSCNPDGIGLSHYVLMDKKAAK